MQKRALFFGLACILLLSFPSLTGSSEEDDWRLVLTTEIKLADYSAGIPGVSVAGFLNESFGIAICSHGEIRYTNDGGKTWPKANYPNFPADLDGLEILDAETAWCCGASNLRVTYDGGRNWEALPNYSAGGRHLSFINRSVGWFGNVRSVALTQDGGRTWTQVPLPQDVKENIMAIQLASMDNGYVLLNNGLLYRTKDGGKHWSAIRLPLKGRAMVDLIPNKPIEAVRFLDDLHGVVVLYAAKPRAGFFILETEDGGRRWREENLPREPEVRLGNVFLSRDARYLTINDLGKNRILVFKHLFKHN